MSVLVEPIVRPCPETEGDDSDAERTREWLVTNGLGGYASGTVCGVPTRRYHGLLIAALPTPLGRMMMLNQLQRAPRPADGSFAPIGVEALVGRPIPDVERPRYQVPPRGRAASLAVRGRRSHPGEAAAPAPPPEHGLRHLPTHRGGRCGRAPSVRSVPSSSSCGHSCISARTTRLVSLPHRRSVPFHGLGRPLRDLERQRHPAVAGDPGRPRPGLHPRRRAVRPRSSIRSRPSAATSQRATSGARGSSTSS